MMTRMDRAEAHMDEITAGAVRAVARTLDSAGTLNDLIREAAERAVRAHLQGAAQAALVDALEGDFGKAPEEQVEQALTERCLRARAEAAQPWHVRGFLSFRSGIGLWTPRLGVRSVRSSLAIGLAVPTRVRNRGGPLIDH